MRWRTSKCGWLVALGLIAQEANAHPSGADESLPEGVVRVGEADDLQGLHERWQQAAAGLGVPGYSVAIVKDRKLYAFDSHGFGDAARTRPVGPETMFYIASATKTYTALALAVLADDGRVDLDAPVATYLDRFELADPEATRSVTIRDLLCHRPGIEMSPIVWLDAYTGQITEDRFYHWLKQARPSGEVTYSNVHFTIAGRVIEAVTGKKWQDFLQADLFEPLGMLRTTAYASRMYADPDCAFPMEEVAEGEFAETALRKTDRVMHAAGGMGTTAGDAARWIELFLNGGQLDEIPLVSPDVVEEALAYQSRLAAPGGVIRRRIGYGLGWFLGEFRGRRYAEHEGGYAGTAAHLSFLPDDAMGVAVLANSSPGGQRLATLISIDVYDRLLGVREDPGLLPQMVAQAARERAPRAAARLEREQRRPVDAAGLGAPLEGLAGTYASEFLGELCLQVVDGQLEGRYGDLRLQLFLGGPDQESVLADTHSDRILTLDFLRGEGGAASGVRIDGEMFARSVREDGW